MNKHETGSGGGAAVAVVMILVLFGGLCFIAVLGGVFMYLGFSRAPIAPPPVPVAVKTVAPIRMVVLSMAADSSLTLDGAPVELDALADRIQQLRNANSGSMVEVTVRAEPEVPFKAVNEVAERLASAGVPYVLATSETDETTAENPVTPMPEQPEAVGAIDPMVDPGSEATTP